MSILDLYGNGLRPNDKGAGGDAWLGENCGKDNDFATLNEIANSTKYRQQSADERASKCAKDDAQHQRSESVDNLSETAQRFCVWGIDCGIVALFLIGIVIAAGDWGSTLLNTVAFFGGITLTIGTSAFAGWLHSKLGDVWE